MSIKHLLVFAVLAMGIVSCKPKEQIAESTEEDAAMDEMFAELAEEEPQELPERPRYNPSETRVNDLLHTDLDVEFDWKKHYLFGKATLKFKPYFYPTDSLTLDAKGMDIHEVMLIRNKARFPLKYDYDDMFLRIDLDKEYTRDEEYTVYIRYTAKPDELEQGGSAAIAGDKGLYFINSDSSEAGKPTQIWTQGETEASSCWFPTIDAPNEKTTQRLCITVDEKYKTLSNGILEYSTDNNDGSRTDCWKQTKPHAPYLFMMAIGDFAVVEDTWTRKDGSKMPVHYYVEKEYEEDAMAIFGDTPDMIEYFSNLLGVEYQWDKYHQVIVRDYVSGAMENTSAVIHGEFVQQKKRELIDGTQESIIAHELFHHWFGDLVTCESWANLPLNESFANYSQYLWDEHKYGRDEADMNAESEMMGYIFTAQQQGYVDMIRFDHEDKENMFDGNSYNKGGRILHMLRNYVGDDAFFSSLEKYLKDNQFTAVEIHDLRLAFEDVTGEDMNWFFNQWFLDKGHPILTFEQEYDTTAGKVRVVVTQEQDFDIAPVYKLPMAIDVYANSLVNRYDVTVDEVIDTFEFEVDGPPSLVNIDAEKMLLCEKEEEKPQAQWIFQYYNAPLFIDRKEALLYCEAETDERCQRVVLDAMNDKFWGIRQLAISNSKRTKRVFEKELKAKLMDLAQNDPDSRVRSSALKRLEKYFSDDEKVKPLFREALNDSSLTVMATGLRAVYEQDNEEGFKLARKYEDTEGPVVKTTVGTIYATEGGPEQNEFFTKNMSSVGGFNKISFLKTYARYLKNQDDELVKQGLEIFADQAAGGGSVWNKFFGGYQILFDFQGTYRDRIREMETEIESIKEEGGPQSEIQVLEQKIAKAEGQIERIKGIIEELKKNETNEQVLMFLGEGE